MSKEKNNPGLVVLLVAMGFSSGLPLYLIGTTLQAWMTEIQVNLKTIGVFSLVGLPYTLKFLWAPLVDRFSFPFLGRRRGWMLFTQLLGAALVVLLGSSDPLNAPLVTASLCLLLAVVSATQDIVVDGYRAEILDDSQRGMGAATGVVGYRLGMLFSGAGALWLASYYTWATVYLFMAAGFIIGIVATLCATEPKLAGHITRSSPGICKAFVEPMRELLKRSHIIEIVGLVILYKLGEAFAASLVVSFILSDGYSKLELASIQKFFGLLATISGSVIGAWFYARLGLKRALMYFGVSQALPILGLSYLAVAPYSIPALIVVIGLENFTGGMATIALAAFCMALCKKEFSATHYAVLSSLASLSRTTLSAPSGYIANYLGWNAYFIFCTILTIPALLLLLRYDRWRIDGSETI